MKAFQLYLQPKKHKPQTLFVFVVNIKNSWDLYNNRLILMGAIRSAPDKKINIKAEKLEDLNYVEASVCGWQHIMQDYTGYAKINEKFKVFFVIDGHGGPDLAQIAIQQVPEILRSSEALRQQQYKTALENLFQTLENQLKKQNQRISLIRQKYGLAPLTQKYPTSGFSMVVALIGQNEIIIGNVGECKAYVCYNANPSKAVLISGNHSETNNDDDTRVKNAGGYFINGRTNGIFPFTRSIGDYALKQNSFLPKNQQILVSTPSIFSLRKQDIKFFVLGSSGLWQNTNFVLKYLTQDDLQLNDLKVKTQKLLLQELICKNPKQSQTGLKNIGVVVIDLKI